MGNWSKLQTEQRNPATERIDEVSTLEMLAIINREDALVPAAVAAQLAPIAEAVDLVASQLGNGGRLFYLGAGTSGRLGILDAAECPPTFSADPEQIQGLIAGGQPPCSKRLKEPRTIAVPRPLNWPGEVWGQPTWSWALPPAA